MSPSFNPPAALSENARSASGGRTRRDFLKSSGAALPAFVCGGAAFCRTVRGQTSALNPEFCHSGEYRYHCEEREESLSETVRFKHLVDNLSLRNVFLDERAAVMAYLEKLIPQEASLSLKLENGSGGYNHRAGDVLMEIYQGMSATATLRLPKEMNYSGPLSLTVAAPKAGERITRETFDERAGDKEDPEIERFPADPKEAEAARVEKSTGAELSLSLFNRSTNSRAQASFKWNSPAWRTVRLRIKNGKAYPSVFGKEISFKMVPVEISAYAFTRATTHLQYRLTRWTRDRNSKGEPVTDWKVIHEEDWMGRPNAKSGR